MTKQKNLGKKIQFLLIICWKYLGMNSTHFLFFSNLLEREVAFIPGKNQLTINISGKCDEEEKFGPWLIA